MKKKFAWLAVVMVAMMFVTSCGSNAPAGGGANPPASAESAAEDSDGRQMEGNMYLTGLPIVKEKETFTMLVDDNGTPEEKVLYQIFEEQTNVHVELILFPYETAKERKNIMINSGDYPDAMGGWILTDNDVMTMSMIDKIIIPLEGLFEKYAPRVMTVLDIPGVRDTVTLPDGHIYTLPYAVGEPLVTFLPWINVKYLEQVGLPMPETTEDFKNVLIAFRDKLPLVEGQKVIPFSGSPNNLGLGTMAGWFGLNASSAAKNAGYFAIIDGEIENTAIRPEYKEFVKYFADLYKEGLIDQELFTQDEAAWKAKGMIGTGLYGVSFGYGAGDFAPKVTEDTTIRQTDYEALPVLRAPGVDKPVFRRNGFGVTIFRTQLVITDAAENPETIVRWWNNVFELDNSMTTNLGPYGIGIEKLPDGQYRELDKNVTLPSEEERAKYEWGAIWTQSLPKYQPPEIKILPPEGKGPNYPEKDIADALYEPYLEEEVVPDFWIGEDVAEQNAELQTAITDYINQKTAQWVSGQADVEAEWDAYLAQLDKLGLQELIKIKKDAYAGVKAAQ
ncbi:MAG: extracellular solute-binding protein [Clostridiales bacterium]|jgi:putative aldouronate transport system substrate-binding protein|nr:extracellular solute-binding protein [Clostridiales bacterium]